MQPVLRGAHVLRRTPRGESVCAAEQCVKSGVNAEFYVDLAYAYCTADLEVASDMFENGCCDVRTCGGDDSIISNSPTPYLLSASPTVRDYDSSSAEDDTDDDQGCLSIDGEMCTGCKGRLGRCNNH